MATPQLSPIGRTESLTEQVREALVVAIASGRLRTGEIFSMQSIAQQMGVSRTPVREAMLQLQQRGIVRMVRSQGALIIGQTAEDLRQIFQVREWIEVPATAAAARRAGPTDRERVAAAYEAMASAVRAGDRRALESADRAFHAAILELSGNDRAARIVDELRHFVISHGHAASGHDRSLEEILEQHRPIVEAFERADGDAAAAAMARHLRQTAAATLEQAASPSVSD